MLMQRPVVLGRFLRECSVGSNLLLDDKYQFAASFQPKVNLGHFNLATDFLI